MTSADNISELDTTKNFYLSFRVGEQWYAVDVQYVFEVTQMVTISGVPDMPEAILGVVNVRGSIVPVLDLRIRFRLEERPLDLTTPIIFIQYETGTYGMVVDDIDDVFQLSENMIGTTALKQRADHIKGLIDHQERLTTIIDPLILLTSSLKDQDIEDITAKIPQEID